MTKDGDDDYPSKDDFERFLASRVKIDPLTQDALDRLSETAREIENGPIAQALREAQEARDEVSRQRAHSEALQVELEAARRQIATMGQTPVNPADTALANSIDSMDSQRRKTGMWLIAAGLVLIAGLLGILVFSLPDARFFDSRLMRLPGYAYLLVGRGLIAVAVLGTAAALIRGGQMMMLPATFVKEMHTRPAPEPDDRETLWTRMLDKVIEALKAWRGGS